MSDKSKFWASVPDVCWASKQENPVAIFPTTEGQVFIRQRAPGDDDDPVIALDPSQVDGVIAALADTKRQIEKEGPVQCAHSAQRSDP